MFTWILFFVIPLLQAQGLENTKNGSNPRNRLRLDPPNQVFGNSTPTPSIPSPPPPSTNGTKKNILPLAKPYCFLLPSDSSAEQCARESVNAMVKEYARAGVQLVPYFAWWGSNYPKDPEQLKQAATQACDLQTRNPWMTGKNAGSIQVFTKHEVPNRQCNIPPKEYQNGGGVAGCSSLCESGQPSFSTVSEDQCSSSVSIHESGHSNCCDRACLNVDDCSFPPDDQAGCGLCMKQAFMSPDQFEWKKFYANTKDIGGSCSFTSDALASIRAGASPNPGFPYDPKRTYEPAGKRDNPTIFNKNGQVAKIPFGSSDSDDSGNGGSSSKSTAASSAVPRQTRSISSKGGSGGSNSGPRNTQSSDKITSSPEPKTYSEQQGADLMRGN